MSASRWGAQFLTRHPILLDEMLDARSLDNAPTGRPSAPAWPRSLAALEPDMERQMDVMRESAITPRSSACSPRDLAGLLTVEARRPPLRNSPTSCSTSPCPVLAAHQIRHREAPKFAVISYGKLGGKELGYASDLDIVFLHDDAGEAPGNYPAGAARRQQLAVEPDRRRPALRDRPAPAPGTASPACW